MHSEVGDVEARIAEALLPLTRPRSASGPAAYVRRHLVEHAAAGDVLDGRILNGGFLPYVDADRLRRVLGSAHGDGGVAAQWRQVAYRWRWDSPAANAAFLQFRSTAADSPVDTSAVGQLWSTRWARCALGSGQVIGHVSAAVTAVATLVLPDGRPIAVTGSQTTRCGCGT